MISMLSKRLGTIGHIGIFYKLNPIYACSLHDPKKIVRVFFSGQEKSFYSLAINFVPLSDLKFLFGYFIEGKTSYLLAKKKESLNTLCWYYRICKKSVMLLNHSVY